MPYADEKKQKAYVREWSREYQKRKRDENKAALERIMTFPDVQQMPKTKQKELKRYIIQTLSAFDRLVDEKLKEAELYAKIKIDEFYDQKLKMILDLSVDAMYKVEQLREMLNKNE